VELKEDIVDGFVSKSQAQLLTQSLRRISCHGVPLAKSFYAQLFSAHPEVRQMFHSNMDSQYGKLDDMLVVLVSEVLNPDMILQPLRDMAKRHVEYGVTAEMYPIAGDMLMQALRQLDAVPLSQDELNAWSVLLDRVNAVMMDETLKHTA